jgi:hypothetical protein
MSVSRVWFSIVVFGCVTLVASAENFATFPEQKEFASPDKRYVLRSIDPPRGSSDFSGMFHSLILEDRVTGQSRRLYDYLSKVAVAWSGDRIIVTDYVSRRSARALVLSADATSEAYIVDRNDLAGRIPGDQAACLRGNDHVFVEAVRMEDRTLTLRVWGYGAHDRNGFRLDCELNLDQGAASCHQSGHATPEP